MDSTTAYQNLFDHSNFTHSKKVVVFCNQSAFDFYQKKYLIDQLMKKKELTTILIPEHGLFAEQQDQVKIEDRLYKNVPCISMYNKSTIDEDIICNQLDHVDALVVDIRDVGVRYFTYTNHLFQLLSVISKNGIQTPIYIINRPNPIGNKIEGSLMSPKYASLLGEGGMIHRHGMDLADLCVWFVHKTTLKLNLHLIEQQSHTTHFIPPSPNLPNLNSMLVYPGQCLWEATTFSEGRGTTTPFELFGHPNLTTLFTHWLAEKFNQKFSGLALIRPTSFIPVHHKHKDLLCHGWQLYIEEVNDYHTIFGTLFLMRVIRKEFPSMNFWLPGTYEFDSPLTAAQTLIGDDDLINYVNDVESETAILKHFSEEENSWNSITV